MREVELEIIENKKVSKDIYFMRLKGDISEVKNSGEFINITLPSHYLRRPISVNNFEGDHLDILFKVLGLGTKDMSSLQIGHKLNCLVGLGNGFDLNYNITPVLVAGGIGIAPFSKVISLYNEHNIKPILVYGARSKDDIVILDEFKDKTDLHICTDDGSLGFKGNVIELIKHDNIKMEYYYACGPYIMLKNLAKEYPNGEVSLEARMGCGFGACMGCSIKTSNGPKRVCKEGPVFKASEVEF